MTTSIKTPKVDFDTNEVSIADRALAPLTVYHTRFSYNIAEIVPATRFEAAVGTIGFRATTTTSSMMAGFNEHAITSFNGHEFTGAAKFYNGVTFAGASGAWTATSLTYSTGSFTLTADDSNIRMAGATSQVQVGAGFVRVLAGASTYIATNSGHEFTGTFSVTGYAYFNSGFTAASGNTLGGMSVGGTLSHYAPGMSVNCNASSLAGATTNLTATANDRILARVSNTLQFTQVSNAMFRGSAANSVVGRASTTAGAVADIAPTANRQFLGSTATGSGALSFRTLQPEDLPGGKWISQDYVYSKAFADYNSTAAAGWQNTGGQITAPVAGTYMIRACFPMSTAASAGQCYARLLQGGVTAIQQTLITSPTSQTHIVLEAVATLTASQAVRLEVQLSVPGVGSLVVHGGWGSMSMTRLY